MKMIQTNLQKERVMILLGIVYLLLGHLVDEVHLVGETVFLPPTSPALPAHECSGLLCSLLEYANLDLQIMWPLAWYSLVRVHQFDGCPKREPLSDLVSLPCSTQSLMSLPSLPS